MHKHLPACQRLRHDMKKKDTATHKKYYRTSPFNAIIQVNRLKYFLV